MEPHELLKKMVREQEVAAELQKQLFLQQMKHEREAQKIKKESEQNYAAGKAEDEDGWRKELEILTERHKKEIEEQEQINKSVEEEIEKALEDAKVLQIKIDKNQMKREFWKTKYLANINRVKHLGIALGKTATALVETADNLEDADAAYAAAVAAITAAADSIYDTSESVSVAIPIVIKAYEIKKKATAIKAAEAAAAEAAAAEAAAAEAAAAEAAAAEAAAAEAAAAEAAAAEAAAAEAAAAEAARIEALAAKITAAIVAEITAEIARANAAKATTVKMVTFIF